MLERSVGTNVLWTPLGCHFLKKIFSQKSDNTSLFALAPALFTCHGVKKHINLIVICPETCEVQQQGRKQEQVLLTTQTTTLIQE